MTADARTLHVYVKSYSTNQTLVEDYNTYVTGNKVHSHDGNYSNSNIHREVRCS